ncbi:MAG: PepSY domain-containing protein [Bacillota bacterium]
MKRVWSVLVVLVMILSVLGACSCTPQAGPSPSPVMTPQITSPGAASPGVGTPGMNGATIPNFLVGTVVPIEDVPAVKKAIDEKYPGATIQSVTHAEYQGKQVYSVTLIDKDSKNVQVYVDPAGTITEGTGATTGSPMPTTGTTTPKS